EDSFVRAQWAAKPFVWHIYSQQAQAHQRKLEAFLGLYCAGLPKSAEQAMRGLWLAWNAADGAPALGSAWRAFRSQHAALVEHARSWSAYQAAMGELAGKLARFCRAKLK
ncbi:MAG: elongation factor P maturation arginine rhamnosyltransferase EarP, partial [Burkholderiales bacterium]|nr:elongation factor P maturation arginine rhamnosyltransferase EarP [Burkholderiales bacterium]